jgi:cytochrome c553
MKNVICTLALVSSALVSSAFLIPGPAAAEKPDWAFPVTEKDLPAPRIEGTRLRPAPPGSTLSIERAKADDMFDIPNWYPEMYPAMPKSVQFGNKETQTRACGSCHLPTGTGHDESAYVAGLPVAYFIRQLADWKNGDRKYGAIMIALAKSATEAEIKDAANYFASVKPRQWIRVAETDTVPKTFIGPGNKRLVDPAGGTEPMGNRIIEVPENEEDVVYRDPRTGFVACTQGQYRQGRGAGHDRRRQDDCVRHLPRGDPAGPGRRAGHCGPPSQLHRPPDVEHPERRPRRRLGGPHAPGRGKAEQRRHAGDRGLCGVALAMTPV